MLPVSRLPAGWQPAADTLADRVVLVTGAYGGLGGAVARAASRAGATVVITGKRKRQLEQLYDAMLAERKEHMKGRGDGQNPPPPPPPADAPQQ